MNLRFLSFLFLFLPIYAQESGTFLRVNGGFTTYTDDQDKMPLDNIQTDWATKGWGAGLTFGYRFSPILSLQLSGIFADYPQIKPTATTLHTGFRSESERITAALGLQINPLGNKTVSPYLRMGGHGQFLTNADVAGYGASAALGIQFNINESFALFLESAHHFSFPNPNDASTLSNSYKGDIVSLVGGGLHLNLNTPKKSAQGIAPKIKHMNVPKTGFLADSVYLSADLKKGTEPIEYIWDLGNGIKVSGQNVVVQFDKIGNYFVSLKIINEFGIDIVSKQISIINNPDMVPAEQDPYPTPPTPESPCKELSVKALTLPNRAFATDNLLFDVVVDGTAPNRVIWTLPNDTLVEEKTFQQTLPAGRHNIKIYLANACSAVEKGFQITIVAPKTCQVAPLKPIFFALQDPLIMGQNYNSLDENLDTFIDCSNICITLQGVAAANEFDTPQLTNSRLEAVADFYQFQGVNAKRIKIDRTPLTCTDTDTKKCRKVETVATICP